MQTAAAIIADRIKKRRQAQHDRTALLQKAAQWGRPVPQRHELGIRMMTGLADACSLSHVSRNLALSLYHGFGVDVRWQPERCYPNVSCASYLGGTENMIGAHTAPYVAVSWAANAVHPAPSEVARIGFVTTDHGWMLGDSARPTLETQAATVVLSPECADSLAALISRERIHLLPLGVDHGLFTPQGRAYDLETVSWLRGNKPEPGAFVFLCIGYAQPRKGFRETAEAFVEAFAGRRDVALIVKTVSEHWGTDESSRYEKVLMRRAAAPPVGCLDTVFDDWSMAALLRTADCVVNAHHREGFGLMPLQAMACGTPAIVTDYHGPRQYANADNCYLLPVSDVRPEPSSVLALSKPVMWGHYDSDVLGQLMLEAAAGRDRERIIAAGLSETHKWTWQRSAASLLDCIEGAVGNAKRRPAKWHSAAIDFSLVVCVRNGADKFERMIASLSPLPPRTEALVLDDASDPAQASQIAATCEKYGARLTYSDRQVGCGGARAILYEQARGKFICSLDADLDFGKTSPTWLEELAAIWAAGQAMPQPVGIVAPLLLLPNGNVWSAGGCADTASVGSFILRGKDKRPTGTTRRAALVATSPGAFHFFHSSLLDHVSMDSLYFPCMYEDSDFAYQVRATGRSIFFCPDVRVTHDANTYTGGEGRSQIDLAKLRERFDARWRDRWEEDLRLQDETGALELL